jgi:hypothetical protein
MDINAAVTAIEEFLMSYEGVVAAQVRPSGDDTDVIKIWVDLAGAGNSKAWAAKCEEAIRKAVPGAAAYRLQVRAEAD